jgi:hypothetical protein
MNFAASIIMNKAAGVRKLASIIVLDIRINELIQNPSIFSVEPNQSISNSISIAQLFENFKHEHLLVWTKLHNRLPNMLLSCITQYIKLRLIGPNNNTFSSDK